MTGFPAGSIFAGQGALIDLGADSDAVMRPRAFQFVVAGRGRRERSPAAAAVAAHALFRNALREAQQLRSARRDRDRRRTRAPR